MEQIAPQLSTPFPNEPRKWKCPKTGLIVPTDEEENKEYRLALLRKAEHDVVLQRDLLSACRESKLFWISAFGWTLWEQEVSPETHGNVPAKVALHPFIPFERQREMVNFLEDCFDNGHDGLIDKSRDMGASWLCSLFFHHIWLFRPQTQLRMMSRVEDLVDSPISKSLFYKVDLVNTYLPSWMCPPGVLARGRENRTNMRIHNAWNGSTIAGESTNKQAMSGDRAAIVLLDEFSKVENGESIKRSTAAVTPCRIVNSTVDLPGSCYSNWKNSGTIKVFPLMAWDHPRKGKGRFVVQEETGEYRITSPFIEHEIERNGRKEVDKEVYAKEGAVGDTFFTNNELDKHAAMFAKSPIARFNIKLRDNVPNAGVKSLIRNRDLKSVQLTKAGEGELQIWAPLSKGRLDQSKTYIIGIDIAKGQGGEMTSETVAAVKCKQTGEKVACWASRTSNPYNAARTVAALALWVGGAAPQRLPFTIWEMNGPGLDFGDTFVNEMGYPHYYRSETVGEVVTKKTRKWGWHSTRDRKIILLRAYERALREGRFVNRDKQALDQAKTYITHPSGYVGPAELSDKTKADYLGHGDRVIADALTVMDKEVMKAAPPSGEAPEGTWGRRFNAWKTDEAKKKRDWRKKFSFA